MKKRHTERKPVPSLPFAMLLGCVMCLLPWFSYPTVFFISKSEIAATLLFFLLAAGQLAVLITLDLRNRIRGFAPTRCLPSSLGYFAGALFASAAVYLILVVWGNSLLPYFTNASTLPGVVYLVMLLAWIPVLVANALWVALSALIHALCANHRKKHALNSAYASPDITKTEQ